MADLKQWFKVWTSILTDPALSFLHNQTVGAWLRLCALTAQHGTNGILKIPSQQLLVTLHLSGETQDNINKVIAELKTLNITFNENEEVQKGSVTLVTLQFLNWQKYQAYSDSYDRVNKFRKLKSERYICNVEKKRREEKREEERRKEENKDYLALSDFFLKEILAKNPHSRLHSKSKAETEKLLSGWAADFRLLVEKDKQPMELIRKVIVATTSDSFWSKNVLSGKKLREKWDTLVTLVPFVECPNVRTEKTVLEKIQESEGKR